MQREEMGQTDFGNRVAIPHPSQILGNGKFVMAAILEQPVFWGHHDVQVVFLISLAEQDPDAEAFYRTITNYLSEIELVEKTVGAPHLQLSDGLSEGSVAAMIFQKIPQLSRQHSGWSC